MTVSVEEILADHHECHSEFQMKRFVLLEPGTTPFGIYKQCLRELYTRHYGMFEMAESLKQQQAQVDRLESMAADENDFELLSGRRCLAALLRQQADNQREYDCFLEVARALKVDLGELTPERRTALDEDMWFQTTKAQAAIDQFLFLHPGVSRSTLEMIISFPPAMRQRLLAEVEALEKPGMADRWLETAEIPLLPAGDNGQERLAQADRPPRIKGTAGPSLT